MKWSAGKQRGAFPSFNFRKRPSFMQSFYGDAKTALILLYSHFQTWIQQKSRKLIVWIRHVHNSRKTSGTLWRGHFLELWLGLAGKVLENLQSNICVLTYTPLWKSSEKCSVGQSQGIGPFYKNSFIYLWTTVHFFSVLTAFATYFGVIQRD